MASVSRTPTTGGLVNALLQLEHIPLYTSPRNRVPSIHRSCDRGHSLLTATRTFTVHVAVPPSAYPPAFPGALASETIPLPIRIRLTPTPHRALECPIERAGGQLLRSWGRFGVALRIALSAGVLRNATWIIGETVQPFPVPVLDQADNPRRLVADDDGSAVRSCPYPYATVLDGIPWWVQRYRLSGPLHRFESQSPQWGLCITPASGGEEFHLYLPQVIKILDLDLSSPAGWPFRENGSQPPPLPARLPSRAARTSSPYLGTFG